MRYLIPQKIDVDELICKNSISLIKPFRKNHLLYIIHLISSIPAHNKSIQLSNGFVPVHAQTLQTKVRNYRQYLEYLVAADVLVENRQYIPGRKSKGFKFSDKYRSPLRVVSYGKSTTKKKPAKVLSAEHDRKYEHLHKWFTTDLTIDQELAMCYIEQELMKTSLRKCDDCNDPVEQYNRALSSIEKISHRAAIFYSIDEFGFRLHTPLTNLKSALRNFLTYKGMELVSVDINNSQPFMSSLLFSPTFWSPSPLTEVLTHESIGMSIEDVFTNRRLFESFIMLCKNANDNSHSDLHKFVNLVKQGTFYEDMAASMNHEEVGRKEIKAAVFQVLFTDNRFIEQKEARHKRIFRQEFPDVYEMFSLLKSRDKKNVPKLLQRIESHEILLGVTKQIATIKPDLPIFTIHDSIVTVKGNEAFIVKAMEQGLSKTFGFPPKLSISHWSPHSLLLSNGVGFNQSLCRA